MSFCPFVLLSVCPAKSYVPIVPNNAQIIWKIQEKGVSLRAKTKQDQR